MMKKAIKIHPTLGVVDDDTEIIKNFGLSRWNNADVETPDDVEDQMEEDVMRGTVK